MQRAQRSLLIYVLDSIGCFPILSTAQFSSYFNRRIIEGRPSGAWCECCQKHTYAKEQPLMNNGIRYVGLDVHRDSISVAVLDYRGKLIKETVIQWIFKSAATRACAQAGPFKIFIAVCWSRGPARKWRG